MSKEETSTGKGLLARATVLVMAATAFSRVIGYVREIVIAGYFGVGPEVDAYRVAVQLPNLFRMLLADAVIAAAFIPVFSTYLSKKTDDEAWKIASSIINATILFLGTVTILGMIFAPQLISILAPGFMDSLQTFNLSVELTRIMFPALVFMALSGIVMGILNSYNKFFIPAFSPVIWNFIIIISIVLFGAGYGIYSLAAGLTVATVIQVLFQLPSLFKKFKFYKLKIFFRHPGVKEFFIILLPIVASAATVNINTIVDTRFASTLASGSVSSLGFAIRVYLVPVGIFAIGVSTVLFPTLSRQSAMEKVEDFRDYLSFGIRSLIALMMPFNLLFIVYSLPIIRVLFERGAFGVSDSFMTAGPLAHYSVGLIAFSLTKLMDRAFYAKKNSRTPFFIAIFCVVINYFGDWAFIKGIPMAFNSMNVSEKLMWLGSAHSGVALSTSLVGIVQIGLLLWAYRRHYGTIKGRKITITFLKSLLAGIISTAASYIVYLKIPKSQSTLILFLALLAAFGTALALYLALAVLFKLDVVMSFISRAKRRIFS